MTDRYAVVGNPIAHSKSPAIHAAFARQTGQDLIYEHLLAPLDGFGETIGRFRAEGGKGLNVTVPFKLEAHDFAAGQGTLTPRAAFAGAVNTLAFRDDGSVLGDNTDGLGLLADLVRLGTAPAGRRVLLIGAGGAARGVLQPMMEAGPASLTIVNRTVERARELADRLPGTPVRTCSFDELAGRTFDLVVNASSSSLADADLLLPTGMFAPGALAYDMMYGAQPTPFMRQAQALGANRTADGLGMLVGQAAESFRLWRGVLPDTEPVLATLRAALSA